MGSEKTKVIILAVVFLLLLGAVGALVFMNMNKKSAEEATGPAGPAPVNVAAATAAPEAPQLLPPAMPTPVQLTVPINLFVSQVVKFGKQPVQFTIGPRYYAESPDGGPEWGLRFGMTFLFPKS